MDTDNSSAFICVHLWLLFFADVSLCPSCLRGSLLELPRRHAATRFYPAHCPPLTAHSAMLEVELKFPLDDAGSLRERLVSVGAVAKGVVVQSDAYFNHPARDFTVTDEALRIRTVGDESVVTYKGPKQGSAAKTRFELELPLASQTTDGWSEMLTRLGFCAVATVRKRRELFELTREGRKFELTIDEVEGLGAFAEVETVADDSSRDAAERAVLALAAELGLTDAEPRSYLEMLLTKAS
jgi:adenylate cyclase class 2